MTTVKKLLLMAILTCGMQCSLQALNLDQIQEIISFNNMLLQHTNPQAKEIAQWLTAKIYSSTTTDNEKLVLLSLANSPLSVENKITSFLAIKTDEAKNQPTSFLKKTLGMALSLAIIATAGSAIFLQWQQYNRSLGWS